MEEQEPILPSPGEEQAFRVAYLVSGFLRHSLTESEQAELDAWVMLSMDNQVLFARLIDEKRQLAWLERMEDVSTEAALSRFRQKLHNQPPQMRKAAKSRYAVAITICGLLVGSYFFFFYHPGKRLAPVVAAKPGIQQPDINAGVAKAILSINSRRLIALDTLSAAVADSQAEFRLSGTGSGELVYGQTKPAGEIPEQHTLSVPRGGQYKLILPDGSRVWLNAASQIRYPSFFTGARRVVQLDGEAYFEVAHKDDCPFEVHTGGYTIAVLGTHFNVRNYGDDGSLSVVLAQGSVRFNDEMLLKPGQQAILDKRTKQARLLPVDTTEALGWKNGMFVFSDQTLPEIMKQVSRWYDADIVFHVRGEQHFTATVSRSEPVSKLLRLLSATKTVHFSINNKTIDVMP